MCKLRGQAFQSNHGSVGGSTAASESGSTTTLGDNAGFSFSGKPRAIPNACELYECFAVLACFPVAWIRDLRDFLHGHARHNMRDATNLAIPC